MTDTTDAPVNKKHIFAFAAVVAIAAVFMVKIQVIKVQYGPEFTNGVTHVVWNNGPVVKTFKKFDDARSACQRIYDRWNAEERGPLSFKTYWEMQCWEKRAMEVASATSLHSWAD